MRAHYYKILGLEEGVSDDKVKKAYKKLAKRFHPDINPSPDAHQKFLKIQEAYDVIINKKLISVTNTAFDPELAIRKEKKRRYEAWLKEVRRKAERRTRRNYLSFRNSGYFTFARVSFLVLLFIGFGFLVLPVMVFFYIIERGILISIFCVPIGMHIINITYQHYINLYPPEESRNFLLEKLRRQFLRNNDKMIVFAVISALLILEMIVFYYLIKLGASLFVSILLSFLPLIITASLYLLLPKMVSRKRR
ncbi:MAG: J domain-containing protein [Cytophagaceae bacterium]